MVPRNDNAQGEKTGEEKMWGTGVDQISEEDKWMIDAWIEDANGILAFTGLLSATIGAFIIEFYKKLSPDSGGQTVDLLGQISQQLSNSRNGTSIVAVANQPFSPSVYVVWVIGMWLISLVFSITSALITSLNQQAVRRYLEMPKIPHKPNDRARVRLLLFRGIKLYKMPLAILAAPTLLHLSILLFFGGLVIVFHTVYKKVALALDVAVGVSGLVYMAMSLLPLLDLKCPYRTPVTHLLWYSWHAILSFSTYCGFQFTKRLPACSCLCPCPCLFPLGSDISDKPSEDGAWSEKQYILRPGLSNSLGKAAAEQKRFLTDGIRKSVINGATRVEDEDRRTITWLFRHLSLGDKNKFLVFAASIPRHKVIDLIPPIRAGKIVLRKPLLVLLRSCTDEVGPETPDEDVRRDALSVCLTAIHDIAKASSIPDLNFVRGKYASIDFMRVLWDDRDDFIRITSRSICALVARQVIRKRRIDDADLNWLEEVTGESSDAILEADDTIRDQMNFKSFVYGALPNYSGHLSAEDAMSFNETLAVLLDVGNYNDFYFTTDDGQIRLNEEVGRIQHYDPEGGREVFGRLHSIFPSLSVAPEVNVAPMTYLEAPSTPSDAPSFYHGAPFVHHGGPSSHVVPSPPEHRPRRRAARSSHATRPPLVSSSPPVISPPRVRSSRRAPSPPEPYMSIVPPQAPSPHEPSPPDVSIVPPQAHSRAPSPPYVSTVVPPQAPSSQAPFPPYVYIPPHAPSLPPPHVVPPSPVIPSAPSLSRRAGRSSQAARPSPVTPTSQDAPPPRVVFPPGAPSPSHEPSPHHAVSSQPDRPTRVPPPRSVYPTYTTPSRAAPSSSVVPPPSVPPTPRAASPSRTTRHFHTARPPHPPI